MPKNAYFGYHYQPNLNIIVVPTVSLSPPHSGTKQIADPKTSSPTFNCEQITPVKDNIGEPCALPCRSNCNQQNLPVVSSNTSTSTKFSDNFKNSLCVIQDKISTETLAFNKSQSIQDLFTPTPKYKPRHNLVDLTGFNIPKREKERNSTSSLLKHKDLRLIDDPKIEQDKMKTSYNENEHRDYSDSDNYKTDNISKESSTNAKPTSTYSERNTENLTCGESKTNKTDMEDKMKKYFKQLWKGSFEKIKAKAPKGKHGRAIKSSSKTTQENKDSKEESSRGKAYLQKISNSNSTNDLRNKIIERRFMAKYTKRSKSETNSRHLPDSKVSIRDRRIDLSPVSTKRYKDFQRFIRHNDDHEIKYKSRNQIKTENLPRKKIRMKSCETTTNKPVSKNNIDERKRSIKSENRSKFNTNQTNLERVENYPDMKRAIDQNNTDRVKLIKSVVLVGKNFHKNLSQRKRVRSCTPDGVEDLRLRLSRKRARSEYLRHYHEPMENRLVQESPMITVNQDVQADSKNSPILAPTVNKPKLNKCKKIKLFINIVCPIPDSVNSDQDLNESCSSPEDFSFLEDLNIDEIVDSLNIRQVEPNKTIDNDYKHNDQTKPKEGPINDVNMKAIEITKKEETSSHKEQVRQISSDVVDEKMNIEIGSVANTKKCIDEHNTDETSKVDRNIKQEANNITDLTGKGYEKSTPKETVDLGKDEENIKTNSKIGINTKQEANNKTDLNRKHCDKNVAKETTNTTSKHLRPTKPILTSTLAKKANLAKSKFQLKPSVNKRTGLVNKNVHYTKYEDKTNITNLSDDDSVVEVIDISDENVHYKTSKHLRPIKPIQTNPNLIQESVDAVEVSLETTLFNSTKHQDTGINMDIEQSSSGTEIGYIQKEIDVLQTAQIMTKVPFQTMSNIVDQNYNLNEIKIELSNVTDKDIKIESEKQKPGTQILPETTKNGIEQNDEININSEPSNVIKENLSRKSGSISKNSLETEENILEKAINKMDIICRSSKYVKEHLQTFEDIVNKPQDKPINKIEQKTNNVISSPQSKNKLSFDSGNSTTGILETAKSFVENCLSSSQIDIRSQSSLGQNNKPKGEPLLQSVETIKTSSKATIDNAEQKINIRSESNKSDKNIEEKKILTLQNSEVKSEKSLERSNIQYKSNVTTNAELTNPDKNIEVTSRKTSIGKAENSPTVNNKQSALRATTKLNVENQTKSETVKNNTQKLETIDDPCDLNKITIKDSELGKRSEIATNNKTKQEQVVSNKTLFPGGSKNKDEKKSNKQAEIFTPPMQNFLSKLESRMSEYLQKKYSISSVIHNGRFSTIYKCFNTKGKPYAVKVVKQLKRGMLMEGILFVLQKYRPRRDYFMPCLICGLEVENNWCLLSEYYPVNLKQALHGYTHGFHINRVQVLSRQLVDAVKMLTNAGIIHSDIKPSHILLSNAHDRLKLCGFDRSNYRSSINITPCTGTPIYRAPEVILGFQEDHRIDLWSTALVIFEMATNKTLFTTGSNNSILSQQLCTFGSLNYSMLEQSRFGASHFYGSSFLQKIRYKNYKETRVINSLQRNDNLRRILFQSYEGQRARDRSKWQMWNDMHKFELLHRLLKQMLVLDPRNRLPIQFVGASEFMNSL